MFASFAGPGLSGFLLCVLFLLLLKEAARKWNFLSSQSVPLIGGISMGAAFFTALFLLWPFVNGLPREIKGILIASAVILISGVWDDQKELSVLQKFAVQLTAAAILVGSGVRTDFVYAGEAWNVAVSILWILGITNAVNLLDVMDGLAGGTALMVLAGFCVISSANGDALTLTLSLALSGAVLGFLAYNLPPAKVYMGNSGSHFLGLLLAALALTARYATLERPVALLTPLVLLGFPIFDTLFLIFMRVKKGKSVFNKSNDHMALRLLKKGHSKWKALALMMALNFFFVVCGVLLSKVPNLLAAAMLVFVAAVSVVLTKKMGRVEI